MVLYMQFSKIKYKIQFLSSVKEIKCAGYYWKIQNKKQQQYPLSFRDMLKLYEKLLSWS